MKEYYFYQDNVPSHAYMKYLYKYPQTAFPYLDLLDENKRRSRRDQNGRYARQPRVSHVGANPRRWPMSLKKILTWAAGSARTSSLFI